MNIEIQLIDNQDTFGRPLAELCRIIEIIKSITDLGEEIIIDLSRCRFANPFLLGGLVVIQKACERKGYNIQFNENFNDARFADYLKHILFPECANPISFADAGFDTFFRNYSNKNFIPLTIYPGNLNVADAKKREHFITEITRLIITRCRLAGDVGQGIRYIISEALDNIIEHAQSEFNIIFAQFYPNLGYLDLVISDCGVGLLGSYQRRSDLFPGVVTYADAMQRAISGQSTKGDEQSRGFGIRTSRSMLVNGLNGKYFLMSGETFYFNDRERSHIGSVANSPFDGVLLALRVPISDNRSFRYTDYLE
jgi:anti-sigma regulatory factor (Ser/Thr protein kinase)